MVSGGARNHSGPPADPNSGRQQRLAGDWTALPVGGRDGDTPCWPLTGGNERELTLWADLWSLPQAVMWEQLSQQIEVALYVRKLTEAEIPGAPVTLGTLVRQYADSLGLTTAGMRANKWKLATAPSSKSEPADVAPETTPAAASKSNVIPMRDRARKAAGGQA